MFLVACAGSRGAPVGVSSGGAEHGSARDASVAEDRPMLAGLPANFRTAWTKTASRLASEHDRFNADVYQESDARFAEDLFFRDAAAGVYLLEQGDGGVRFAVADPAGRVVADSASDAGPSLHACASCHAGGVFPIAR